MRFEREHTNRNDKHFVNDDNNGMRQSWWNDGDVHGFILYVYDQYGTALSMKVCYG